METINGPGDTSIEVTPSTLLLVDDEENILASLRRLLRKEGYRILTAPGGQAGLDILASEHVDIIISDQRMPQMVGTVFLKLARDLSPHSVRMILSGYTDLESVTSAINEGAVYKFLTKPWDDEILRLSIKEALHHKWIQDENRMLHGMLVEVNNELANANKLLAERAEFAQDALRNTQEILFDLPIPLLGIDGSGLLIFANKALLDLLGGTLAIGRHATEALPEEFSPLVNAAEQAQLTLQIRGRSFHGQKHALSHKGQGHILVLTPREPSC